MKTKFLVTTFFSIAGFLASYFSGNLIFGQKKGNFEIKAQEQSILVILRGQPIAELKDQGDHYKFFLTGTDVNLKKALLSGSIDDKQLVTINWEKMNDAQIENWNWTFDEEKISYNKRVKSSENEVSFGDVLVGQHWNR